SNVPSEESRDQAVFVVPTRCSGRSAPTRSLGRQRTRAIPADQRLERDARQARDLARRQPALRVLRSHTSQSNISVTELSITVAKRGGTRADGRTARGPAPARPHAPCLRWVARSAGIARARSPQSQPAEISGFGRSWAAPVSTLQGRCDRGSSSVT